MAHRMEDRYQTMSEFVADLDRFSRGEWIPFWGRVKVKSWLRFSIRAYPKAVWATVGLLLAALVVAGVFWLPRIFDPQRALWGGQLDRIERNIKEIRDGSRLQLTKENRRLFEELRRELGFSRSEHSDLAGRLGGLSRALLERAKLEAWFAPNPDRQRVDFADALRELQVAARVESPAWHPLDDKGLLIQDYQTLTLGPYGVGSVYALCRVQLPPGSADRFRLEVREADDPRHVVAWTVTPTGMLQLGWREDYRPVAQLRLERPASNVIQVGISANAQGVHSLVGTERTRHPYPGLREGAPAVVQLDVPKGALLLGIEVYPQAIGEAGRTP
jgi:hypothetical protein